MILFPPSKINLGLNVLSKRADGFHDLVSCMYPIPLTDVLEILPSTEFSFIQTGLQIAGMMQDNLCIKAYNLMCENFSIKPVYIHLRKEIPMGAGIGGGSADAAYVLKGLNELYNLQCTDERLEELAAELGSDCPFFIKNKAQFAEGRGEILSDCFLDLSGYYLKFVYPGIHVSTKEAFAGIQVNHNKNDLRKSLNEPIIKWRNNVINDFEESVFSLHSELAGIKEKLYFEGALYASMSGSGSAIYGIFKEEPQITFNGKNGYLEVVKKFLADVKIISR